MSKLRNILKQLNIINDVNENSVLLNLVKKPPKEGKKTMPKTISGRENAIHQADLLFLPDDDGYKYILVVVDVATRKCDCQELKSKDSKIVRDALIKIYKRGIIKIPSRLDVDGGGEFKKDFETYFKTKTIISTKKPYRHRQQSIVESRNHIIGNILNTGMLGDELNTDKTSKSWVHLLHPLVKLLNENYSFKAIVPKADEPERVNEKTKEIIPEGTKVRVKLDAPQDYVDGKRLNGNFRAGDLRYDPKIKVITQFYLNPGQPPMYQLDGDGKVAYSFEQLQIVKENEVQPPIKEGGEEFAQEIKDKRKENGVIEYLVKWERSKDTWETRKNLIKQIPDMVKEFEKKLKEK
jgi:hypothetical protein